MPWGNLSLEFWASKPNVQPWPRAARYDLMSRKFFTHATPTLFNAGTPKPQMSSCFLLKLQDDSIEGIYDTLQLGVHLQDPSDFWLFLGF